MTSRFFDINEGENAVLFHLFIFKEMLKIHSTATFYGFHTISM